ncbi:hypothetical protein AB5J72_23940 [Streptomyces sp. CG1]|uniref:hypothetical protein n=1 Tax=Streptomyces sp. CG1 TaxID=1287523 RepID=UPI0034E205B8
MSACSHTWSHPATTGGGADIRLPWWALALSALAFVTLLALILNPSDAHAATGDRALTQLFQRAQELFTR